jgi:hypothetical protein
MKINFLNVLKQKSASGEIAEQIVLLEAKQAEVEAQKDALRREAKELRQRKLCAEAVPDTQIKEADVKLEDITLTMEAISESLTKLRDKLRDTLEEERRDGHEAVQRTHARLIGERKELDEEFARMRGRLLAFAESILGPVAETYMKDGRLFQFDTGTQDIYLREADRARAAMKRPTYYEKKRDNENYSQRLTEFDLDKEFGAALARYRASKQ